MEIKKQVNTKTTNSAGSLAGGGRKRDSKIKDFAGPVKTIGGNEAFMGARSKNSSKFKANSSKQSNSHNRNGNQSRSHNSSRDKQSGVQNSSRNRVNPGRRDTQNRNINIKSEKQLVNEPRFTAQKVDGQKTSIHTSDTLKIIGLGGMEETGGKNCTVFEYKNDIVIIDMGLMFPSEDMPGIDYVIPDVSYLEKNKSKIRGMVVTHGHLDHIGAIPYVYEKIGSPAIYSAPLSIGILKSKLEEFGLDRGAKLHNVEIGETIQLGVFKIKTFKLTHSIPQTMGLAIETPEGLFVYVTDWKFDHTPADGQPADFSALAMLGGQKPVALLSESTNVERPGVSVSEKEIEDSMVKIYDKVRGRLIIATFSTLISRIQQILKVAHKFNRKVAFVGRSMVNTVEIATSLEAMKIPPNTVIDPKDLKKYPDDKIVLVCTGSQGEDNAALSRIATGQHRTIKIKRGDTVVLSSSPIPGNERAVSGLMDNLYREGARVIYQKLMGVHTSGHAKQEDLKLMIALIKPKYLIPIHGERHRLMLHGQIAADMGLVPEERSLVADDGQVIEFSKGKGRVTNKRVPASYVMVDGLGVGDIGNIVLRDRKAMAQDGIFVIIVTVDHKTGEIATSPDIISRGFIYMRENEQLVHKARAEIKKSFSRYSKQKNGPHADWNLIRGKIRDEISEFLFNETERRPMVIPVVIEV